MSPLRAAWRDFSDAASQFSRPARHYLLAEFMAWTGHGVFSVLFNLYLVEAGFDEAFVGHAISVNAIGLAIAALPAGWLAERWGRRRCLIAGALCDGAGLLVRASTGDPTLILTSGFLAGAGQSMLAIAAAPFLTEHSTARERTHLFSSFFASALLAGVVGSALGGVLPRLWLAAPWPHASDLFHAYRAALLVGGVIALCAAVPLLRLRGLFEPPLHHATEPVPRGTTRRLWPIALNALLIGCGAGLVIPFMNLYFKDRHHCTSAQIGTFFSIAQVFTALAALFGPAFANRFGKLRTAVVAQLMSLPFLVTLGAESSLPIAVGAFWMRATLMQAATPLVQAFVMEALPPSLRARSTSLINLVWNIGWAVSASLAGAIILRFGFAVPFYLTAGLYATAALTFYLAFRRVPEHYEPARLSEEAKGRRGEGAATE